MCAESRMRRRQAGFTLVEMLVAVVVIAVGLAGVLLAYSVAVRGSGGPVVSHQMLSIAEEMLEEIQLKPYAPATTAHSGCARATFAGVLDYNGYDQPVCAVDGTAIPELSSYRVRVDVAAAALNGVADARRITVTVTRGGETLSLAGWRTNYGD